MLGLVGLRVLGLRVRGFWCKGSWYQGIKGLYRGLGSSGFVVSGLRLWVFLGGF